MNNEENVLVKFSVTEKDYTRTFLYMRMKYAIKVLISGFLILMIYLFTLTDLSLLTNFIISALSVLLIAVPLSFFAVSYKAKKEFRSDHDLREELTVEANDLGLNLSASNGNSHRDWDRIYSVREIKHDFIVYFSKSLAFSLPKSYFGSEKDISLFKELVSKHINSDKVYFQKSNT